MEKIIIKQNTDLNKIASPKYSLKDALSFDANIYDNLPKILKPLFQNIDNNDKKDSALTAILTILSGIIKNYKIIYDDKLEGCQLYFYLFANPGRGKGFPYKFREVGIPFHKYKLSSRSNKNDKEESKELKKIKRLFLSSNSSKASLLQELYHNDGYGVFFISEADTIISANKSNYGEFSDILRNGFSGESVSANKVYYEDGAIEIDNVFISFFVTSTLSQCFKFSPSYEDGLFSRFCYFFVKSSNSFNDVFSNENKVLKLNDEIKKLSNLFLAIGKMDEQKETTMFKFTDSQANYFQEINKLYVEDIKKKKGEDTLLTANYFRLGVSITRICMLLTYLRNFGTKKYKDEIYYCSDVDFNIGISMMQSLESHLQLLIYNYEAQNKNVHNQVSVMFPKDNQDIEKQSVIELCIKLDKQGLSTREISKQVFGNTTNNATVFRWIKKYKKAPLPFHETETATTEFVDAKNLLLKSKVSFFENLKVISTCEKSLYQIVVRNSYKTEVERVRKCKSKEQKDEAKKKLPGFTASGLFNQKRGKQNLIKHSGFICIDIDKKDNEHIENFNLLGNELRKISNVAFCSKSIGGEGYYLLIPINNTENHEKYFEAIKTAFNNLGIVIDKQCKDVSRFRFVSDDIEKYVADNVILFDTIIDNSINEQLIELNKLNQPILENLILNIEKTKTDITANYEDWFAIGCALANTFKELGLELYKRISQFYPNYNDSKVVKQFEHCLSYDNTKQGYSLRTIFFIANKYDVRY